MFLSAIYILSPVDIIPEGIFGFDSVEKMSIVLLRTSLVTYFLMLCAGIVGVIGLLDDALIALICFLHIATLYRSVLVFRHGGS